LDNNITYKIKKNEEDKIKKYLRTKKRERFYMKNVQTILLGLLIALGVIYVVYNEQRFTEKEVRILELEKTVESQKELHAFSKEFADNTLLEFQSVQEWGEGITEAINGNREALQIIMEGLEKFNEQINRELQKLNQG
jgi:hypothetical protein